MGCTVTGESSGVGGERIVGAREAAERLHLSERSLRRLIRERPDEAPLPLRLPVRRLGWREQDLDAWVRSRSVTGATP